ncbi:microtubule-associated protein Jupiter-like [Coccinella septempunctata]|uniref:microtubule-associated protein Jupiter-like n=1 Tax=Coccinella septempunctata TaxID=41139 RepID=UPI001D07F518|nr:microtubule-associated protein Jupiter-like [Coccinella septempunctata]
MATYAAYRHIELDKVGYSKKRVRNPSSEIFQVLCTPPTPKQNGSMNGTSSPRRGSRGSDSFTRLFGQENSKTPPRRASLTKQDVKNRNPVTGDGVDTWDSTPNRRNTPRVRKERNPVTGEEYTIISPAVTPTKSPQNGFAYTNGNSNSFTNGNHTNGEA